MTMATDQNFQLFKSALASQEYLNKIISNEINQLEFLDNIENNKLNFEQVLELIPTVNNSKVKSLLISHLFSSKVFIDSLSGKSFLLDINDKKLHEPSRLNFLAFQMDVSVLSPEIIERLQPEAAISILYAIPHYHKITLLQVRNLLQRHQYSQVISCWLKQFSTLPNAQFMLAHLLQIAPTNVSTDIAGLSDNKKQDLGLKMLENLSLFENHLSLIPNLHAEELLILAIQYYLHGHKDKIYIAYINQTANSLLDKNHQFSLSAVTMLLALNGANDFKALNTRTAYLTNYNVRKNALAGNISIFYNMGKANSNSMLEPLVLQPEMQKVKKPKAYNNKNEELAFNASIEPLAENPLIRNFSEHNNLMPTFIYFLIHYHGDTKLISKAINDYLSCVDNQSLHFIYELVNKSELNSELRKCLFEALLQHLHVVDDELVLALLLYDAPCVIKYFGMRGKDENYNKVILIANIAINKLTDSKDKALIDIANRAKWEAEQELRFTPATGFFSTIFNLLKRCWIYGWTGFFTPNNPQFVLPAFSESLIISAQTLEFGDIVLPQPQALEPKRLISLVKEIKSPYTNTAIDEIVEALQVYSLEADDNQEIDTRRAVHELFHQILYEANKNPALKTYMENKQHYFIANRCRLLECLIQNNLMDEQDLLFAPVVETSLELVQLISEFRAPMPEIKKIEPPPPPIFITKKAKINKEKSRAYSSEVTKVPDEVMAQTPAPPLETAITNAPLHTIEEIVMQNELEIVPMQTQAKPKIDPDILAIEMEKHLQQTQQALGEAYISMTNFSSKIASGGASFFNQTRNYLATQLPTNITLPANTTTNPLQSISSFWNMLNSDGPANPEDEDNDMELLLLQQ